MEEVKAYQDGGQWWVPWTGNLVPNGAQWRDRDYKDSGWMTSNNTGRGPGSGCEYRIPATAEQIAAAQPQPLRAESPPWIEKSWGRTRQIFAADGVEIWESEGKAGRRTSWHNHPGHEQTVQCLTGELEINSTDADGAFETPATRTSWPSLEPGVSHELRFKTDCRFLETYVGEGSVSATIVRLFQ